MSTAHGPVCFGPMKSSHQARWSPRVKTGVPRTSLTVFQSQELARPDGPFFSVGRSFLHRSGCTPRGPRLLAIPRPHRVAVLQIQGTPQQKQAQGEGYSVTISPVAGQTWGLQYRTHFRHGPITNQVPGQRPGRLLSGPQERRRRHSHRSAACHLLSKQPQPTRSAPVLSLACFAIPCRPLSISCPLQWVSTPQVPRPTHWTNPSGSVKAQNSARG
ncbi:hypothetical protein NDU88_003815 [Pleurodeles waltl]|uniref:Uncharacterized protein n=1 Tax=Pleurodeles waltl TaxID=8319 RepID=A0AAV7VEC3_PLEWA|nr:hypothetical protein NDU88_003815 [Pleurodeles waltl]